MITVSAAEFTANVSSHLSQVMDQGETVIITDHGGILARVIPEVFPPSDGEAFLKTAAEIRGRLAGWQDNRTLRSCVRHGRR